MRRVSVVGPCTALATLIACVLPTVAEAGVSVGTPSSVSGTTSLIGVACPTDTTCYATGSTGGSPADAVVVTITNGVVTSVDDVPANNGYVAQLWGISCVDADTCYAVGEMDDDGYGFGAFVPITAGVPGEPQNLDPGEASSYRQIACESDGGCEIAGAGGDHGIAAAIMNGRPVTEDYVSPASTLDAVACAGVSTSCIAFGGADEGDYEYAIDDGTPGTGTELPGIQDVKFTGCAASGFCLLGGLQQVISEVNGQPSASYVENLYQDADGSLSGPFYSDQTFSALACADASDCIGLGGDTPDNSAVAPINGQTVGDWTEIPPLYDANAAACPPSGACVAVGDNRREGEVVPITIPVTPTTGSGAGSGSGSGPDGGSGSGSPSPSTGGETTNPTSGSGSAGTPDSPPAAPASPPAVAPEPTVVADTSGSTSKPRAKATAAPTLKAVSAERGVITLAVLCSTPLRCTGTVTATASYRQRVGRRDRLVTRTLERTSYSIATGARATITLTLSPAQQAMLARIEVTTVKLAVAAKPAGSRSRLLTVRLR